MYSICWENHIQAMDLDVPCNVGITTSETTHDWEWYPNYLW